MWKLYLTGISLAILSFLMLIGTCSIYGNKQKSITPIFSSESLRLAYQHLAEVMNKFHRTSDVYTDAGAAGNLFVKIAKMASDGEEEIELVDTDVACTENPHSGATCIKNSFKALDVNWGGVYFQNGVLFDGDREPRENWGEHPDAGYNLTGATKLTFWARGAKGGEQIEFFAFGVGRNPANDKPIQRYPDSSPKVSRKKNRGYVTLSKEWQQYFLLRPAGAFEQKVTVSRWIVG